MNQPAKTPALSRTEISRIVRPMDANTVGTGYGGHIMDWMDMAASICARRHSNRRVNTVSVYQLNFIAPLHVGHVAKIIATMTRAFSTSMEVHVMVFDEDTYAGTETLSAAAFFILVGLNEEGKPARVPELTPETEEEKRFWSEAAERRKLFGKPIA